MILFSLTISQIGIYDREETSQGIMEVLRTAIKIKLLSKGFTAPYVCVLAKSKVPVDAWEHAREPSGVLEKLNKTRLHTQGGEKHTRKSSFPFDLRLALVWC